MKTISIIAYLPFLVLTFRLHAQENPPATETDPLTMEEEATPSSDGAEPESPPDSSSEAPPAEMPAVEEPPEIRPEPEPGPLAGMDEEPAQIEFYDRFIYQRLEVGTRSFFSRSFDDTRQGDDTPEDRDDNYFGTIDRIDPDYSSSPTAFYIQYALCEYAGVGLSFDDFELITQDRPYTARNTDGNVTVDSALYYVFLRYPNEFNVVPFVELGYASHDIGFDPEPSWAARGNSVAMTDDSGTYYALGVAYDFNEHLSVNLIWRAMSIASSGEYRVDDGRDPVPFEMNFDHEAWGLGVQYTF